MLCGCSDGNAEAYTAVFEYDDFGPQVAACELIGMGWYQWDNHGYEEPDYKYNIKVVVYYQISLDDVKRAYPTVKGEVDYRYVTKERALSHLKSKIAEFEEFARSDPPNASIVWKENSARLKRTLRKIEQELGQGR
jgi:hypothetical protein